MSAEQDVARYMAFAENVFGKPRTPAEWDAVTLERAVEILRARTTKPRSWQLKVLCGVLLRTAEKIRRGEPPCG